MMAGDNDINIIDEYSISLQSGKQAMMWKVCGYVPAKLELQHLPTPAKTPQALEFGKVLFKSFPPEGPKKLFKCHIIGPFQVIHCPHSRESYQITVETFHKYNG